MQLAALDDSSHSVETSFFAEGYKPTKFLDAELVIGKVIDEVPGFDGTLGVGFAETQKAVFYNLVAIGYSSDDVVTGRVCSMRHMIEYKGRQVTRSDLVSIRRLDSGVAFDNGLLDTEVNTMHMLYFHQRDMKSMRLSHGDTALVMPTPVFGSDTTKFGFSLGNLRRQR